jgi:hypothetical protein
MVFVTVIVTKPLVGAGEAEDVVIALEKVSVMVALTIVLEDIKDSSGNMLVEVGSLKRVEVQ